MPAIAITPPQQAFPIYNGYAPKQGSKALPLLLDFATNALQTFDINAAIESGQIDFVQSVWIDNKDNTAALTLTVDQTGQVIKAPASSQNIYPVIACDRPKFSVATTAVNPLAVQLIFLNVPMPLAAYGPFTFTGAVTANMTPISKNMTQTKVVLTGADQILLAANAGRTKLRIYSQADNGNPVAFNYGAAAVLADNEKIFPGFAFDSGVGPVSGQQIRGIGTLNEVVIITEG